MSRPIDVEALNDRLATEHPIDDYYARSALPIRLIERRRLAIIREMVGDGAGQEIAEVGSGGGHVLRMFPRARLTAIDVSQVFLDTARKNLVGFDARFLKGEIDKLALPAQSFDRIICTEVLEHTVNPAAILAEIARLLRPDGVAVITVPNDPLIHRLKQIVRRTPVGWAMGNGAAGAMRAKGATCAGGEGVALMSACGACSGGASAPGATSVALGLGVELHTPTRAAPGPSVLRGACCSSRTAPPKRLSRASPTGPL